MADVTFQTDINLKGADKKIDLLNKKIDLLSAKLSNIGKGLGGSGKIPALEGISGSVSRASTSLTGLDAGLGKLSGSTGRFASAAGGLNTSLGGLDAGLGKARDSAGKFLSTNSGLGTSFVNSSGKLSGFQKGLTGLSGKLGQLGAVSPQLGTLSSGLNSLTSIGPKAGLALGGVAVAGLALTKAVQLGVGFNDKMTQSLAIMGPISDDVRGKMEGVAKAVGKDFNLGAEAAAESYFFLASAGLNAEQSMAALPAVAAFAKAGMFDMARATDLATDAQSALGLASKDPEENLKNLTRVTDVFVKANTLANTSVEQVSTAMTNKFGAALRAVGKDVEEGTAVLAAFADQGLKGEAAGTAASIVTRDLQTAALKNQGAFKKFGVTVFDTNGEMRNYADIIGDLEGALDGMSDAQKKSTLAQLGFQDKSQGFLITLLGTSDKIRQYETDLRGAGGTTKEIADKQMGSLAERFKSLQVTLEDFALRIFDALEPALAAVIDVLGALLDILSPVIDVAGFLISIVAGLVRWVVDAGKAFIDWVKNLEPVKAVIAFLKNGFQLVVGYLKNLYEKFKTAASGPIGKFVQANKEAWKWLSAKLAPVLSFIGDILKTVFIGAWKLVVSTIKIAINVVKTVVGWYVKMYEVIFKAIKFVVTLGEKFKFLNNIISDAVGFIKNLIGKLGEAGKAIADFLGLGGSDVVTDDMKKRFQAGVDQITAAINASRPVLAKIGQSAVDTGEEVGDGLSTGVEDSVQKAARKTKEEILDFADVIEKSLREIEDSRGRVRIDATLEEGQKIDFQNEERIRKIKQGINDENDEITKKIEEAKKKQAEAETAEDGDRIKLVIKNLEEARKALSAKEIQLLKENDSTYRKEKRELFSKRLEEEIKLSNEALAAVTENQRKLIEAQRAVIDTTTIEGLRADVKKELDLIDLDWQGLARSITEQSPRYKEAVERIGAQVEAGILLPTEGAALANAELNDEILSQLKDTNSLLFAEYQKYLSAREKAAKKSAAKIKEIEEAELLKGNALLRLALAFREDVWATHFQKLRDMKKAAAEEDKKIDDKALESLRDRLSRGVIDRTQFLDELSKLNEDVKKAAGEQYGYWDAVFGAVKDALGSFTAGIQESMKATAAETAKNQEESTSTIGQIWNVGKSIIGGAVADLGGRIAALAADSKLKLKDFLRESLVLTLDALRRTATIAIAEVLIRSIANPLQALGLAGAIVGINLAIGAAQGAISGFREGGYTGRGHASQTAGVVHKGEFVFTKPLTQKHFNFFNDVHRGEHPLAAALKRYGSRDLSRYTRLGETARAKNGAVVDRQLIESLRAMYGEQVATRKEIGRVANEVKSIKGEYEQFMEVKVHGEMKYDGRDFTVAMSDAKRRKSKGYS